MFEHRLLEARKKKGLTQKQLAEQAGVHVASYSAYENNHKMPPIDILLRIADVLDVSIDWLCGRAQNEEVVNTYGAVVRNLFSVFEALDSLCDIKTGSRENEEREEYGHFTRIIIWDYVLCDFFSKNAKLKELIGKEDQDFYLGWLRDKLAQLDQKPIENDLPF